VPLVEPGERLPRQVEREEPPLPLAERAEQPPPPAERAEQPPPPAAGLEQPLPPAGGVEQRPRLAERPEQRPPPAERPEQRPPPAEWPEQRPPPAARAEPLSGMRLQIHRRMHQRTHLLTREPGMLPRGMPLRGTHQPLAVPLARLAARVRFAAGEVAVRMWRAAIAVSRLAVLALLHSAAGSVSRALARRMREPVVLPVIRAVAQAESGGEPVRPGMSFVLPAMEDPQAASPVVRPASVAAERAEPRPAQPPARPAAESALGLLAPLAVALVNLAVARSRTAPAQPPTRSAM
jgi:hypothetical protein